MGEVDGLDDDVIFGDAGDDTIIGGYGNDYLDGGAGDDEFYIYGSGSYDQFVGGDTEEDGYGDVIYIANPQGTGAYSFVSVGITSIHGIEAIENISSYDAYIYAKGEVDLSDTKLIGIEAIRGSSGADIITAGAYYDDIADTTASSGATVEAGSGNDEVYGTSYGDFIYGGSGNDLLFGNGGSDVISGNAGGDTIYGNDGADTLDGGAGIDYLLGGTGNDFLTGGADTDYFWFEEDEGSNIVTDFEDGTDYLVVGSTVDAVNVSDYNGDALLTFDDTSILLSGVSTSAVDASDFLWA
ncbi:calcium-binding protein [Notoacmeibacter ruber]|uniref:Calcium-binding protein n=1 Tax=Notoacmeibacter ruber TaxID=2670375 RepID=A0A3L7J484_9HYPH|nr:calcium-binding protein [Notoacmeibacter ruber]RLQ85290.1 calcium-binding protein [Notoacmeibacter ruber]